MVDRRNRFFVVLVVWAASTWAGCDGRSEPMQGREVSVTDDAHEPGEASSHGLGGLDASGTAEISSEGAPSASDTADGNDILGNQKAGVDLNVPNFYTVPAYDVGRDPAADLIMTITKAKQEQKRILLQVGGDWCNWCGRLAEFMRERQTVRSLLDQHFLIMKVASQSQYADAFLADYPKINAYPFVYVLSPAGELPHSQDMEKLELGEGYDEEAFVDFLEAWRASQADDLPGSSESDRL